MKKTALILILIMLTSYIPSYAANEFVLKIDGTVTELKHKPVIKENDTLLPVREVFEKLGMSVEWDDEKGEIIASANDFKFVLEPGSSVVQVDKVPVTLKEAVYVDDGITFVGTQLFADYMKYCSEEAFWEDKNTLCLIRPEIKPEKKELDQQEILASLTGGDVILNMDTVFAAKANSDKLKLKTVEVSGQPFTKALQAETLEKPVNIYDIQIVMQSSGDIAAGEIAVLSYYARKISTTDESGMGFVGPCYELNYGDYNKLASLTQELDDNWKQYFVLLAPRISTITKEKSQLTFRLGYKPQTVQIADVKIVNYHTKYKYEDVVPNSEPLDTYKGIEEGALWREEALKRIEKIRKRDITVNVKTENGTPVSGAEIKIDMTKNEFMFGTAVHNTFLQAPGSDNARKYRDIALDMFNTVVYDTAGKWPTIEPNKGVWASGIINWANQHDITVRGHALFWDQIKYFPPTMQKAYPYMNDEQLENRITEHINDVMTQYKGAIPQWDVLNEPLNNHEVLSRLGYGEIVKYFNLAKAIDPDASLYINETGISGRDAHWSNVYKLYDLVKNAKDAGAQIDGIGIQDHCGGSQSYPQEFYNQLDYLSQLVDEIAITEYDYTPKYEKLEAPYLRDMLIVAYSHPKCTGFITWGFWDKQHWKNHAPFYKADWTPRETVEVWKKYVQGEWETHESGLTDSDGQFSIRGHRGEYDVSVKYGNRVQTGRLLVTENGLNTIDIVIRRDGIDMTASETPGEYKNVEIDGLYKYRTDYKVDDAGNVSGSGEKFMINELPWELDDKLIAEAANNNSNNDTVNNEEKAVPSIAKVYTSDKIALPSLNDGSTETFYCTGKDAPEIIVELDDKAEVNSLTIEWYENKVYTYNYEIMVSDDGKLWESVCSGRSKTKTESCSVNRACRYIKIKSINPTNFLGIADIKAE